MLRQLSLGSRLEPSARSAALVATSTGSGFQILETPEMVAVGEHEAAAEAEAFSQQQQHGGTATGGRRSPFRSRRLTTCRKRALGIFQRSASVSSASKSIPNRWLTPTYSKDT